MINRESASHQNASASLILELWQRSVPWSLSSLFAAWLTLFIFEKSSLNGNHLSGWLQWGFYWNGWYQWTVLSKDLFLWTALKSPPLYCHEYLRQTDPSDASAVYSCKYFSSIIFSVREGHEMFKEKLVRLQCCDWEKTREPIFIKELKFNAAL